MSEGDSIFPTARVGGIPTARVGRRQLAEQMMADVTRARAGILQQPRVVIATNGLVIALYHRDRAFRALIDQADIVDPDGMPLILASKVFHRAPLVERVATTDFLWDAAEAAEKGGARFFLLGAQPSIAAATADLLLERFPKLQIAGTRHGYFEEHETARICTQIRDAGTDVLWLGRGSPLQEQFAIRCRSQLEGLAWIRTCGGLFDHIGGRVPRAPLWMQKMGFEWLHRAAQEPRRLGTRYLLTNPVALYHLLTKTR